MPNNDAPLPFPPERIAETQRVFSKQYGREVSKAEAIEIMRTVRALVKTLTPLAIAKIAERKKLQNSKPKVAGEENTLPVKPTVLQNTVEQDACENVEPIPQPENRKLV